MRFRSLGSVLQGVAAVLPSVLACTQPAGDSGVCSPFARTSAGTASYEEEPWHRLDGEGRQRVVVLTDFGNEPDDAQSLVRFLLYSNDFDVEGILATTSRWLRDSVDVEGVEAHIGAYGQVRSNLLVHSSGYPAVEALLESVHPCQTAYGMQGVGPGMDSEGSDHLLRAIQRVDARPLWISVWGGANCLAQALWRLTETRTSHEVDPIISRLRVYSISDQDDAGSCIRAAFPRLSYIVSPSGPGFLRSIADYNKATWRGISGDHAHGDIACLLRGRIGWPCEPSFRGPRFELVDEPWLEEHVRSHGALGTRYPKTLMIMEGDTPAFLNLIDNGLAGSTRPDWGGWGGRYELSQPEGESRAIWTDSQDTVVAADGNTYTSNKATIWRWREAYQSDFAARMDWSVEPRVSDANHNPIAVVNGDASKRPLLLQGIAGERLRLDAASSSDPDGDALEFSWWPYPEAGTTHENVEIEDADSPNPSLVVPPLAPGTELHIILEIRDDGMPVLRSYRRILVRVGEGRYPRSTDGPGSRRTR